MAEIVSRVAEALAVSNVVDDNRIATLKQNGELLITGRDGEHQYLVAELLGALFERVEALEAARAARTR
jgi:hypothetical protein